MDVKVIFCLIFSVIGFSIVNSSILEVTNDGSETSKYIRKVIRNLNKKDNEIHDVSVIIMNNTFDSSFINGIIRAIPEENPVLIPKLGSHIVDQRIRKVSTIITVCDDTNDGGNLFLALSSFYVSNWWTNSANFIFITNNANRRNRNEIYTFFWYIGAVNFVILNHNRTKFDVEVPDLLTGKIKYFQSNITSSEKLFPDKLKDIKGYQLKLLAYNEYPKVTIKDGKIHSKSMYLIDTIAKSLNATYKLHTQLNYFDANFLQIYTNIMETRSVDITPNTAVLYLNNEEGEAEKLMTSEKRAYCALVPLPGRISLFDILLAPYDGITWILILISFIGCAMTWWSYIFIHRHSTGNSTMHFIFGTIAVFLQQAIPFSGNIQMQVIMMQLSIFMVFILGNAYQSVLITLMTDAKYGIKLNTVDELLQSEFNFIVDPSFLSLFEESEDYHKVQSRMTPAVGSINSLNYQELYINNSVLIMRCDQAEYQLFQKSLPESAIHYFYLLPERLYSYYDRLHVGRFSTFLEKMQNITDWVFVGGLQQEWEVFMGPKRDNRVAVRSADIENEEYLMKLIDLHEVFYLLLIGLAISLIILILEIFWHDCGRYLLVRLMDFLNRSLKNDKKVIEMKVKRIEVQPVNVIDVDEIEEFL